MDGCNGLLAVESITAETCLNFYPCFLAFLGCVLNTKVVVNFMTCAHKISASLDLCAKSYGQNGVPQPAEKQTGQRGRNSIFRPR